MESEINLKIISLVLIAVLTAVDQLLKMLVVTYLKPIGEVTVINGLLNFKYIENTGASFGMLPNMSWLFVIITAIVSIVIVYLLVKYNHHNFFSYFAGICIVAGGLGNLIDRVFFGYVIDYIYVLFFPYIFNFADCMVVLGVIAYMIFFLFFQDEKKKLEEVSEENNG